MDYWLAYAKDYAVSIGLVLDPAGSRHMGHSHPVQQQDGRCFGRLYPG